MRKISPETNAIAILSSVVAGSSLQLDSPPISDALQVLGELTFNMAPVTVPTLIPSGFREWTGTGEAAADMTDGWAVLYDDVSARWNILKRQGGLNVVVWYGTDAAAPQFVEEYRVLPFGPYPATGFPTVRSAGTRADYLLQMAIVNGGEELWTCTRLSPVRWLRLSGVDQDLSGYVQQGGGASLSGLELLDLLGFQEDLQFSFLGDSAQRFRDEAGITFFLSEKANLAAENTFTAQNTFSGILSAGTARITTQLQFPFGAYTQTIHGGDIGASSVAILPDGNGFLALTSHATGAITATEVGGLGTLATQNGTFTDKANLAGGNTFTGAQVFNFSGGAASGTPLTLKTTNAAFTGTVFAVRNSANVAYLQLDHQANLSVGGSFSAGTTITATTQLAAPAGSTSTAGVAVGAVNTGLYSPAAGFLNVLIAGSSLLSVSSGRLIVGSGLGIGWASGAGTTTGATSAQFSYGGAGIINAPSMVLSGALTASGGLQLGAKTVATLPTASSNTYLEFVVTDSLSPAIGSTVASGGTAKARVQSNGDPGAVPIGWIVIAILKP